MNNTKVIKQNYGPMILTNESEGILTNYGELYISPHNQGVRITYTGMYDDQDFFLTDVQLDELTKFLTQLMEN